MSTHDTGDTLDLLLRRSAVSEPDRVAIVDGSVRWTYAALDRAADALAAELVRRGVGPSDRVALWAEKSGRGIALVQAVLRAGAAIVPIDPGAPPLRARAVLSDALPRVVATTRDRAAHVDGQTLCLDDDDAWTAWMAAEPAAPAGPGPEDLAYVLYTSGSTGVPKGVCIRHRNARAFVDWAVALTGIGADDRLGSHAPLHFDLSIFDLYGAFSVGASVFLVPEGAAFAPTSLVELVRGEALTVWYSVPSAIVLMMERGGLLDAPVALRVLVFAGEVFPIRHLRRLRAHWPGVRFLNWYGPTETNVCTAYEQIGPVPEDREHPLPIGSACAGDRAWVVRTDGTRADEGEEGELVVDGPTVMRGYWGRPPQEGPYPTGDLVRRLPDGDFVYVGRRDHMVKVRGFRVELGDVEAAVLSHPGVEEAAVVVLGTGTEASLVACCVGRAGRVPLLDLKRHCAERLPKYMIVDRALWFDALPRTSSGKVDRLLVASQAASS